MSERDEGANASSGARRQVPAPQLRETADIWFDTGHDPVIEWDETGTRFELVDPSSPAQRLMLLQTERPASDAGGLARVLADGLAACDFPPTADGASARHVAAALRAAGIDPESP